LLEYFFTASESILKIYLKYTNKQASNIKLTPNIFHNERQVFSRITSAAPSAVEQNVNKRKYAFGFRHKKLYLCIA
jgi:hypothetical protein